MKLMRNSPLWLLLRLCAGLVLLAGCAGHHTSSRTSHLLDDKVVTDRVEAALQRASPDAFSHVQVTTAGGVVTLKGDVPDAQAKAKASQVAKGVHLVQKVENELQIRPTESSSRAAPATPGGGK